MRTFLVPASLALAALGVSAMTVPSPARAQDPGKPLVDFDQKRGGSAKVKMLTRLTNHPGAWKAADVELEQDPGRPFVYVSGFVNFDFQVYDIRDTGAPRKVFEWSIEDPELHKGIGAMDGKYFKVDGRYYYAQSLQFMQGTPDEALGAVIFDVTGLPDGSKVREVARLRYPQSPGGFHNMFAYKHSDGRALLFTTVGESKALVWNLDRIVRQQPESTWLIGAVPNPTPLRQTGMGGYHDFYVGYDPATEQDKFYGAGLGGYSVWDVTTPETPKQLFTITSLGMDLAHTFTPTPDGKYAVTETEYQYTPLRIWDLQPGQTGKTQNIDIPISAWTSDWRTVAHNHEVRWPFVFVSAYEDGFQVFDMKDPRNPRTVGHWYTCECKHEHGFGGSPDKGWESTNSVYQGAFGVDVRNHDGLVVITDMRTGLWLFKVDGFNGWNGKDHGVPNISSVQDWDRGPEKAVKTKADDPDRLH